MEYFDKAIKGKTDKTDLAELHWYSGYCNQYLKNYDKACNDFKYYLQKYPDNNDALYNYATCLLRLGKDYEEAKTAFTKCIDSKDSTLDYSYLYGTRAIANLRLGLYYESINDANRAIAIDSVNINHYVNRGLAYVNLDKFDEAIADFTKTISLTSSTEIACEVYNKRGLTFYQQKRYDEAIADFTKIISLATSTEAAYHAYMNRAEVFSAHKHYDEAIADYTRCISIVPNKPDAYEARAYVYSTLERYDDAIKDYKALLKIDDKNYYEHINQIAFLQFCKDDYAGAISSCNTVIYKKAGVTQTSLLCYAYSLRADCYFNLNRLADALFDANMAVKMDDSNYRSYAYKVRAKVNYGLKKYGESIADADKAISMAEGPEKEGNEGIYAAGYYYMGLSKLKNR